MASAALLAATMQPHPASAADFFEGKTIEIVIGSEVGGGFDAFGRAFGPYFRNHIPGKPNVIIKNMPGAGSVTALRHVAKAAPKDGTTIGMINASLIPQSVFEGDKIGVDLNSLTWIGNLSSDNRACFTMRSTGILTFDDLKTKTVRFGGSSKLAGTYPPAAVLQRVIGDNIQVILGYTGNAEIRLAMERGEIEGQCTGWDVIRATNPDWIRDNSVSVIMNFASSKLRDAEYAPTFDDAKVDDQIKQAARFLFKGDASTRPIIAPPEMPAAQAKILRDAFSKTVVDPEFLAYAEKAKLFIDPLDHEAMAKIVREITTVKPEVAKLAKEIVQ
jgi:tripartite-type tricarboxylate transporter receptor subunit TctC